YELDSVIRMMRRFLKESVVDGFEFVLLPEWDAENAPLTPSSAPVDCEKHRMDEVAKALQGLNLSILSVHANRDIGNYVCAEEADKVQKGIRLADECLDFAERMGSEICVFHFWDTWKEKLDISSLEALYQELQKKHPSVEISIENIPTRHENMTPFQIVQNFRFITLDLKWASLVGEFDSFAGVLSQVDNVHVQGKYMNGKLTSTVGSLDYEQALACIKQSEYSGVFTVELEGKADYNDMVNCVSKLKEKLC
ncbi:MAG: TIM barrel protein, partial [Chloroflexota bacterium]